MGYSHRVAKSWTQLSDLVCTHEAELLGSIGRWHPMLLQDQGELGLKMLLGGLPWQVQWLRLCMSNAGGLDLTPGQRTKIPHDARHSTRCQCVDFSLLCPRPVIPIPGPSHSPSALLSLYLQGQTTTYPAPDFSMTGLPSALAPTASSPWDHRGPFQLQIRPHGSANPIAS